MKQYAAEYNNYDHIVLENQNRMICRCDNAADALKIADALNSKESAVITISVGKHQHEFIGNSNYAVYLVHPDYWPITIRKNLSQLQAYRFAVELANNPSQISGEFHSRKKEPME